MMMRSRKRAFRIFAMPPCGIAALCVLLLIPAGIFAQERPAEPFHERTTLTLALGNWQPHSLNDEPRFNTFGAAGATPYVSLSVSSPLSRGTSLCFSAGYWALRDLDEVESVHSLTLLPVSVDFKYRLVPETRLSAYVQYGAGFYWGIENVTAPLERINEAQSGLGINLGAGFDLALSNKLGLGVLFQYHYVLFGHSLGGVQDFSGPHFSGVIHYYR